MALVVEDGTGLPDAESYVSVADCKSYLDARGRTAWGQLTEPEQEQLIGLLKKIVNG